MKLPQKASIPSGVVSQSLGDDVVLLHLHTGVYWSLNATGAVIWGQLQAHGDPQKAMDALCRTFQTTPAEAQRAVSSLLRELASEGLVEIEQAARR